MPIHSTIGDKTIGVKINGNLSPINEIISNGDQIGSYIKGQKLTKLAKFLHNWKGQKSNKKSL